MWVSFQKQAVAKRELFPIPDVTIANSSLRDPTFAEREGEAEYCSSGHTAVSIIKKKKNMAVGLLRFL